MTMQKFKDKQLQRMYDLLLEKLPYNPEGSQNNGSSLHEIFWKGYNGISLYHSAIRLSFGHAAWAAGKEHKKRTNNK